jgi:hypothetical protein
MRERHENVTWDGLQFPGNLTFPPTAQDRFAQLTESLLWDWMNREGHRIESQVHASMRQFLIPERHSLLYRSPPRITAVCPYHRDRQ